MHTSKGPVRYWQVNEDQRHVQTRKCCKKESPPFTAREVTVIHSHRDLELRETSIPRDHSDLGLLRTHVLRLKERGILTLREPILPPAPGGPPEEGSLSTAYSSLRSPATSSGVIRCWNRRPGDVSVALWMPLPQSTNQGTPAEDARGLRQSPAPMPPTPVAPGETLSAAEGLLVFILLLPNPPLGWLFYY